MCVEAFFRLEFLRSRSAYRPRGYFFAAAAVKKKVEALEIINWQVKFDVWNEFNAPIINNLQVNALRLPCLRSHGRYAAVVILILFFQ